MLATMSPVRHATRYEYGHWRAGSVIIRLVLPKAATVLWVLLLAGAGRLGHHLRRASLYGRTGEPITTRWSLGLIAAGLVRA